MSAFSEPTGTRAVAVQGAALTGAQRAAALLMLLGEQDGAAIWSELSDTEIRTICTAMTELGSVRGEAVEALVGTFLDEVSGAKPLSGSADRVEALLTKVFPPERVMSIMSDVRGASGRQVWRRLAHVPADVLAPFLRGEYPQTIAVVVSRLPAEHGGKILALLPEGVAAEVVERVLGLGEVRPEAIENIEDMLYREFLSGAPRAIGHDPYEVMADRFNAFDRPTEARFLASLDERNRDAAARIRAKMFTFEDLRKLDPAGVQTLLRHVDKDVLGRALKGAPDEARAFFLSNLSTRAAKNLQDDMDGMGAIRMKEVDEAQGRIVQLAKSLSDKGEIRIAKGRADDDLVA